MAQQGQITHDANGAATHGTEGEGPSTLFRRLVDLEAPQFTKRLQALKALEDIYANACENETPPGPLRRIARCVISSVLTCTSGVGKVWTPAVCSFIKRSVQTSLPFPFFLYAVEYVTVLDLEVLSTAALFQLSRIVCALLESGGELLEGDSFSNWAADLVQLQGVLLAMTANGQEKMSRSILNRLNRFWFTHPKLLPVYFSSWSQQQAIIALGVLSTYSKSHATVFFEQVVKPIMIELFLSQVLNAKKPVTTVFLQSFNAMLESLSQRDLNESFAEVLTKTMKRSPETAAGALAWFVSRVKVDLSVIVQDCLAPSTLRMLKSVKDDLRNHGLVTVCFAAMKCNDPEAMSVYVSSLCDALSGKGGVLAQWYMRHGVVTALRYCSKGTASMPRVGAETLAEHVTEVLLSLLDREGDEATRGQALLCFGDWAALLSAVNSSLKISIIEGMQNKTKAISAGWLLAVLKMAESDERGQDLIRAFADAATVSILVKIVGEAMKKPTSAHPDGVFALRLLLQLSALSPATLDNVTKQNIYQCVSNNDSFLFSRSLLGPVESTFSVVLEVSQHVACSVIASIALVSRDQTRAATLFPSLGGEGVDTADAVSAIETSTVDGSENPIPNGCATAAGIITCLLHAEPKAFQSCKRWMVDMLRTSPNCAASLVFALQRAVFLNAAESERSAHSAMMNAEERNKDKSTGVIASVSASRYSAVLLCLIDIPPVPKLLPALLLLSAHPFVSGGLARSRKVWRKVRNAYGGIEGIEQLLEDSIISSDINCCILAATYTSSKVTMQAAVNAMVLLGYCSGDGGEALLVDGVVTALLMQLERPEVTKLTDKEIELFLRGDQDEAEMSAQAKEEAVRVANRRRMRSGRRQQVYDVEDEEWEAQVKAEIEAKKKIQQAEEKKLAPTSAGRGAAAVKKGSKAAVGGRGAKQGVQSQSKEPTLSEEDKLQLQKAMVRDRVGRIRTQCASLLQVLSWFARSCPELAHKTVPQAMGVVYPLLRSKLVSREAYDFVQTLALGISDDVLHLAQELAMSVRISSTIVERPLGDKETTQQHLHEVAQYAGVLARAVGGLADVAEFFPCDPATVHFFFPILRAILSLSQVVPGCELAFKVMTENYFLPGETILSFESDGLEYKENDQTNSWEEEFRVLRPLRKQMLEVTLKVMTNLTKVSPSPEQVLLRLTAQVPLSPGEWTPLLGVGGLLNENVSVRIAGLRSVMVMALQGMDLISNPLVESRLWLVGHDADETCAALATQVWHERGQPLSPLFTQPLLALLQHSFKHVRQSAARALILGVQQHPATAHSVVEKILGVYMACEKPKEVQEDMSDIKRYLAAPIGLEKQEVQDSNWPTRAAVGLAFKVLGETKAIPPEYPPLIMQVLDFIVTTGVVDEHECVRSDMLAGGASIVRGYGEEMKTLFIEYVDRILSQQPNAQEGYQAFDWRREGAVVLLGAAAKHLEPSEPRVAPIVQSLIAALSTPSENVQVAVADNLAMLGPAVKAQGSEVLDQLLGRALRGQNFAERRGAALGLAAVVKGLGIPVLKQNNVIDKLKDAVAKGTIGNKQGALFCFETLSDRLGLLFEPYVIVILPLLLESFSDSSDHVRDAAQGAAKVIMQKLSAAGVKQVLTPILKAVPDNNWRTKKEAIKLLGTMAYCAPRQLASCLPQIVPKLCEAFTDTHPKVKDAAKTAMQDICSVIRNPEVSRLSPILLAALTDPAKHTKAALEALLDCEFMHSIDAPSLAILVPILYRGLRDRPADVKRKASVITGNMSSMISDSKILLPYTEQLVIGLKGVLVDPIPDVRARAAKALGSLMGGLGESELPDLIPWLIGTLKAESSPVERSGGAQGLAEVLVVRGQEKVALILHELLPLKSHPKFNVREGVLWLLCFLPPALEDAFSSYIPETLPVVLTGLSDEAESVREVAMRAGQVLVSAHGKQHPMLILPTLENGLFDEDWRIRQSSVQLMGDLMYLIGGTKAIGMADEGEDEDVATSNSTANRAATAIRSHLGEDRTNGVLASIYIVRSDTSAVVRQSALQVWKSIVNNTPRTLREIMPMLIDRIVSALASNSYDKRTVAGRALGDIVRKLGDQVLPEVVPFLRQGLRKGDEHMRQGVCLGLAEIMSCATKRQIEHFMDTLVPAVQDALCDISIDVREQAAVAFQTLHKVVGSRAVDDVVPSLLNMLAKGAEGVGVDGGELIPVGSIAERALFGLKSVVQLKTRDLLQYLMPKLLHKPITSAHALALGSIVEVSGDSLHFQIPSMLPILISQLASASDAAERDTRASTRLKSLKHATKQLVASVETVGMQVLSVHLGQLLAAEDSEHRIWAAWAVEQFFLSTSADFTAQIPIYLRDLLQRLNDTVEAVLVQVNLALLALSKKAPMEELVKNLEFVRTVISSLVSDAKHRKHGSASTQGPSASFLLPGLCVNGGLEPLLPMFFEGLMHGTPVMRETAATGLGELVEVTSAQALKPYLVKTTGPLIRVVGDKYPSGVKASILRTLGVVLGKGGAALRPFVPQLMTTFVKALSDPNKAVRDGGLSSLSLVVELSTRVHPLIADLAQQAMQQDTAAVRMTMLEALTTVIDRAGQKSTPEATERALQAAVHCLDETHDDTRNAAAACIGSLAVHLSETQLCEMVATHLLASPSSDEWVPIVGRITALGIVLNKCSDKLRPLRGEVLACLLFRMSDPRAQVRVCAVHGIQSLFVGAARSSHGDEAKVGERPAEDVSGLVSEVIGAVIGAAEDNDVKVHALRLIKQLSKSSPAAVRPHMLGLMRPLVAAVKDANVKVKLLAERAMMYTLELRTRPETLNDYIAAADTDSARFVRDYCRRVLVRLTADSDEEET